MNCNNHTEVVAVATCNECNKGLCKECANIYTIPICTECNDRLKSQEKFSIYKSIGISIFCGILFWIFAPKLGLFMENGKELTLGIHLLQFYAGAGIIWGWNILTRITPSGWILSIYAWILLWIFKFFISMIIGMFVLPVVLCIYLYRYIKLSR